MNDKAKNNSEYWIRRYGDTLRIGGNYDTMICWSPEEYEDEAANLSVEIARFMGGDKFGKVLDFGCGRARFCHLFKEYEGVDIVQELIDRNRMAHPPGKIFSLIPNAPPDPLNYEMHKSGAILAFTVLQHIDRDTLKDWLWIFKRSAKNLFIVESVGAANEHTYRRDWEETLVSSGYKIKKRETFASRETYDFIWAT